MSEIRDLTFAEFLSALSAGSPTPGGRSVAAVVGGLGAGLGCMVCAIAGKRRDLSALAERFAALRERFLDLADADAAAFARVMSAYRRPKDDPRRGEEIDAALAAAAAVPLETAQAGVELLRLLAALAPNATSRIGSDVGVAIHLGRTAVAGALMNVGVNLTSMRDSADRSRLASERDAVAAAAATAEEEAKRAAAEIIP